MALETTAEAPAPLRQISQLIEGYVGRLGAVWVEAEIAQLTRRQGVCFLTLPTLTRVLSIEATCSSKISVGDAARINELQVASMESLDVRSRSARKHTPWRRESWEISAST